jgi:transcriptional regulator with XRE-family HTH domain
MVNSEEFSNRLKEIFDFYELSASSFADKIDVGRASISHILSGRNKPSLDFVMKVVSTFEEVELYWLLNGKGSFPPNADKISKAIDTKKENEVESKVEIETTEAEVDPETRKSSSTKKSISKVIIFYTDGSFESYENYPKS